MSFRGPNDRDDLVAEKIFHNRLDASVDGYITGMMTLPAFLEKLMEAVQEREA